jgi:hypothetical protein
LDCQLQSAHAVTVALLRDVMGSAGERLSTLQRMGKTAHIERFLKAGACTEAALALLDLEMPNWKIRRLVFEGGEWLCSLSRRSSMPIQFDEMAEARHAVLSLAVLRALVEARQLRGAGPVSTSEHVALGSTVRFCCDNFV